jgi:transcriptional antiterminator NusG
MTNLSPTCALPPIFDDQKQWFAVKTRSNFEERVSSGLNNKGIESYVPHLTTIRMSGNVRSVSSQPLFRGYVFARYAPETQGKVRVLQTHGVVQILGVGCQPLPIPDAEIESVRRLLDSGQACAPHPFLREGSLVRIKAGPLRGLEGRLTQFKANYRIVVGVSFLGSGVSAEVDIADVDLVASGSRHQ